MAMPSAELIAIIGSIFGSALALGVMMMRFAARIDADRRAFQAEAAQDRRALQASMDRFQAEMQRLAERQSRVEATQEVHGPQPRRRGLSTGSTNHECRAWRAPVSRSRRSMLSRAVLS